VYGPTVAGDAVNVTPTAVLPAVNVPSEFGEIESGWLAIVTDAE
jgi:hypothetical protein